MGDEWFEDQEFWKAFRDHMFSEKRISKAEQQVEQLIELLDLEDGDKVLDMPCGVGRHVKQLAEKGFQVTGVDISQEYINEAKSRASKLESSPRLQKGDMRETVEEEQFDAAINMFTSFGYFETEEENMKVLENYFRCLKPDGKLLIDTIGKETIKQEMLGKFWARTNGKYFLQSSEVSDGWKWHQMTWIKLEDGEEKSKEIKHRLYSAEKLEQMLQDAGFSSVEIYGSLDGREYNEDAERLVAVAEK